MAAKGLSQAAYAAYRSVSRKTVTVWKQKGLLVFHEDGSIDVAATDHLLPKDGEWKEVVTRGNTPTPASLIRQVLSEEGQEIGDTALTLTHVRMAVGILKARDQALEHLRARGGVIEIEEVAGAVEGEYSVVRANLMSLPGDVAADLEGLKAAEIQEVLAARISEILNELAAGANFGAQAAAFTVGESRS